MIHAPRFRRLPLALLLGWFAIHVASAQEIQGDWCGTQMPAEPFLVDPNLVIPESFPSIPVVFHVISKTDGTGDLPDDVLLAEVEKLNYEFADVGTTFYLHGVSRTQNDAWFDDIQFSFGEMGNVLTVDTDRALNVYTGLMVRSGFTYVGGGDMDPNGPDEPYDGFLLRHSSIAHPSGTPLEQRSDVGAHEAGHYFSLLHVWGGGGSCNDDDFVEDTPRQADQFTMCDEASDSCPAHPGLDPIHNIMNYTGSFCTSEFTPGQGKRMDSFRFESRPDLGFGPASVIDARSIPTTFTNPTFVGERLYILDGSNVTVSGVVTLDEGARFVIAGDANVGGITAIHIKGGSRFEIRQFDEALMLDAITVEDESDLVLQTHFVEPQGSVAVNGTVNVSGASTIQIDSDGVFSTTGPVILSGGSSLWQKHQGTGLFTIGSDLSIKEGSSFSINSELVVAGNIDILDGSSFNPGTMARPAGDVLVAGNGSRLILGARFDGGGPSGQLVLADERSLTFSDGAAWTNGTGTALVTGRDSQVVMDASAGGFSLPGSGSTPPEPTTFLLGEDSSMFFHNDGVSLAATNNFKLDVSPLTTALPWGSINISADNAIIDAVHVTGAAQAAFVISGQGVTIRNASAMSSAIGIKVLADPEGGASTVSIENTLLAGNGSGLVVQDAAVGLTRSTIAGSLQHGMILMPGAYLKPFSTTVIENSGIGGAPGLWHGILVQDGAELHTTDGAAGPGARNRVAGSAGDAVRVLPGGFAWFGNYLSGSGGIQLAGHENAILYGGTPATYAVNNLGATTISAFGNYWGPSASPPPPGLFNGPVSYDAGLTTDPTGASGCDLPGC